MIALQLQRAEISLLTTLGAFSIHLLSPPFDLHHCYATSDWPPAVSPDPARVVVCVVILPSLPVSVHLLPSYLGGQKAANIREADLIKQPLQRPQRLLPKVRDRSEIRSVPRCQLLLHPPRGCHWSGAGHRRHVQALSYRRNVHARASLRYSQRGEQQFHFLSMERSYSEEFHGWLQKAKSRMVDMPLDMIDQGRTWGRRSYPDYRRPQDTARFMGSRKSLCG